MRNSVLFPLAHTVLTEGDDFDQGSAQTPIAEKNPAKKGYSY